MSSDQEATILVGTVLLAVALILGGFGWFLQDAMERGDVEREAAMDKATRTFSGTVKSVLYNTNKAWGNGDPSTHIVFEDGTNVLLLGAKSFQVGTSVTFTAYYHHTYLIWVLRTYES